MRDIKFRAWDESLSIMVYFKNSIFNKTPHTEKSTLPQYESCPEFHKLHLMQYTGLKDKNGKEIYERDIIKWSPAAKSAPKRLINMWEKIESVAWSDKYTGWFTESSVYGLGLYSHIEVIGNIHENKELLEDV